MDLFEEILYKPVELPTNVSPKLQNLIMQLLEKNPKQRLGYKDDATEIKAHPWFAKVNWTALTTKQIKAPFVPILASDADNSNFDE